MSVYLDHNSTTPVREEVRAYGREVADRVDGNASSLHAAGRLARDLLDQARERAAASLGIDEDELIFTSGGTESNNLALLGAVRAAAAEGPSHLVTTAIEHSSVLQPAEQLRREGHQVTFIGVDEQGMPDLDALTDAGREAGLVSVMAANNEIGTCPPVAALGSALEGRRGLLHTDAAQALGRLPVHLREWGVDLASFSAHKFGGPPGVGLLFRRRGVDLQPLQFGGGQEAGLRPGTENVAAVAAAALAVELAVNELQATRARLAELASVFWAELQRQLPNAQLLGPALTSDDAHATRLPGTLNVVLPNVDGKVLVTRLDLEGLQVSAGSACASGSLEPSHVLLAMGLDEDRARAGLRISLGRTTTLADVREGVESVRRTLL